MYWSVVVVAVVVVVVDVDLILYYIVMGIVMLMDISII
jgi:hypothetical protein